MIGLVLTGWDFLKFLRVFHKNKEAFRCSAMGASRYVIFEISCILDVRFIFLPTASVIRMGFKDPLLSS